MNEQTPAAARWALGVEYEGGGFAGFQWQANAPRTVQSVLESALAQVARARIRIGVSGRTDRGVHATAQVVHFDTPVERPARAWVNGVNAFLPDDVRVLWSAPVAADFHARFSARSRRYVYVFRSGASTPALGRGQVLALQDELDAQPMASAATALLGEHDFSAFRAAACQSRTPMRRVEHVDVWRRGTLTVLDITANAFLLHMVRNIAGCLLQVGLGKQDPRWLGELLAGRDRTLAAATAPAHALYLVQVRFADHCAVDQSVRMPWFLA